MTLRLPFDVGKEHALVAQSTFASKKCQRRRVLSDFRCSDVVLLTDGWIAIKLVQLVGLIKLVRFVESAKLLVIVKFIESVKLVREFVG